LTLPVQRKRRTVTFRESDGLRIYFSFFHADASSQSRHRLALSIWQVDGAKVRPYLDRDKVGELLYWPRWIFLS
jgi:hypothetical protein